jgi:hypothetical protein
MEERGKQISLSPLVTEIRRSTFNKQSHVIRSLKELRSFLILFRCLCRMLSSRHHHDMPNDPPNGQHHYLDNDDGGA